MLLPSTCLEKADIGKCSQRFGKRCSAPRIWLAHRYFRSMVLHACVIRHFTFSRMSIATRTLSDIHALGFLSGCCYVIGRPDRRVHQTKYRMRSARPMLLFYSYKAFPSTTAWETKLKLHYKTIGVLQIREISFIGTRDQQRGLDMCIPKLIEKTTQPLPKPKKNRIMYKLKNTRQRKGNETAFKSTAKTDKLSQRPFI